MTERERPETSTLWTILGTSLTLLLINSAFSLNIRKLIGKRDRWKCQTDGCNASFQTGDMVHASHYSHDKSDPNYDTVGAGRIQCVDHHQKYHEETPVEELGLCEAANKYAIAMLKTTPRKRK
jgi:hypothetical protein